MTPGTITGQTGRELDSVRHWRCFSCDRGWMHLEAGVGKPRRGQVTVYCDFCDWSCTQTIDSSGAPGGPRG